MAGSGELIVDRLLRGGAATPNGASPTDQRAEVSRILLSSAASGTLDPADRQYLVDTVAARAGIPPEEAQQRVDQIYAQAQELEAQGSCRCRSCTQDRGHRSLHDSCVAPDRRRRRLFRRGARRQPPGQAGRGGRLGSSLGDLSMNTSSAMRSEASSKGPGSEAGAST